MLIFGIIDSLFKLENILNTITKLHLINFDRSSVYPFLNSFSLFLFFPNYILNLNKSNIN